MNTLPINKAPLEVQEAFKHVQEHFPEVTKVTYDIMCRWEYDTEHSFDEIDIQILERGADAQYNIGVPMTYTTK